MFQSNKSVYAPSQRQFNELDEDDGLDIREEINFKFNSEYQNEHDVPTIEIEDENEFHLEA